MSEDQANADEDFLLPVTSAIRWLRDDAEDLDGTASDLDERGIGR